MPTIIMDSCNYTRLGLMDYMATKGVKRKISHPLTTLNSYKLSVSR